MNPLIKTTIDTPADELRQYVHTVAAMHGALERIFANKRAISDSLRRAAASLRTISAANGQLPTCRPR